MDKIKHFSKIELEYENLLRLTFVNKNKKPIVANIDNIEAIVFHNYGYMSVYGETSGEINVTFEDWQELRSVAEQSSKFIFCGDNAIFVLENVVDCNKDSRRGTVVVDCKRTFYEIELYGDFEKADDLISALQKRWNQSTECALAEEDTLNR